MKAAVDAGYYTIPLGGSIKRNPDKSKTIPQFEPGWNHKYSINKNDRITDVGGIFTGPINNLVAIDCDNGDTFKLFRELDSDNPNVFVSVGKDGGTILYLHEPQLNSFSTKIDPLALDFMSENKMVYLPTAANESKESWDTKDIFKPYQMPLSIKVLIKALSVKATKLIKEIDSKDIARASSSESAYRLCPLIDRFIKSGKYDPPLFKIITPKSMRHLDEYQKVGHLHPDKVPEGMGSEYLMKVSAILGADPSINIETYMKAMYLINSMWSHPMDTARLNESIINRMVSDQVEIDGVKVWCYDENWMSAGFQFLAKNGDYCESFFDDVKGEYYLVNYTQDYIRVYEQINRMISFIKSITIEGIKESEYNVKQVMTRTVLKPNQPFGRINGTDEFNVFRQTSYLAALNGAKSKYLLPHITLNYFQTFIPDDETRNYVLRFLRTKLTTFNYSPIILHIVGSPGSGKDLFCTLIGKIIGEGFFSKPEVGVFKEKYNSWLLDSIFAQCDEYADALNRNSDKLEVLGKLKTYSGATKVQLRSMFKDSFAAHHMCTFILTANANPLPVEVEDRRFCCIRTGGPLDQEKWVKDYGGMVNVYNQIMNNEIEDFCAYLHDQFENLDGSAYQQPPKTSIKEEVLYENLNYYELIARIVKYKQYDRLIKLYKQHDVVNYRYGWGKNRIYDTQINQLLENAYGNMVNIYNFHNAMRKHSIERGSTQHDGKSHWYYHMQGLADFSDKHNVEPIDTSDGDKGINL